MKTAIGLEGVIYKYSRGNFELKCDKLEFPTERITLITGPNGSGKTTLSKLMCGILRPQRGRLEIFGNLANDWPLGLIGGSIGYLFQEPSRQLFATTIWREMTFVAGILGENCDGVDRKARELLSRFDLLHLKDRSIHNLSRGEKQRLAICTVLLNGAKFLILDEPTTGLDRKNREILYNLIDGLVAEGTGIALISHEKELIARYGKNNVKVEDGRVPA